MKEQNLTNLYQSVTNDIIETLESGVLPWVKPWSNNGSGFKLPKRINGMPYKGINVLILWNQAIKRGYDSPYWLTLKAANMLGASIKPKAKASRIIYFDRVETEQVNPETDQTEVKEKIITRWHTVFNAHQVEGLYADFFPERKIDDNTVNCRNASIQAFVSKTLADIEVYGDKAFYSQELDYIQVPPSYVFDNDCEYYPTLFHELIHWTGHTKRLNRYAAAQRFGTYAYAFEELVAELGAAFLCAEFGIYSFERDDHARYIREWLAVLKNDTKTIFMAAKQAQQAVDYLKELQLK